MKIILYGAGRKLTRVMDVIDRQSVVAIVDKHYRDFSSDAFFCPVMSPSVCRKLEYDYVVILPDAYYEEIVRKLVFSYGVPINRILSYRAYEALAEKREADLWGDVPLALIRLYQKTCPGKGWRTAANSGSFPEATLGMLKELPDPASEKTVQAGGYLFETKAPHTGTLTNYVVTHRPFRELKMEGYQTILAGAACGNHGPYLRDDTGDQISDLNSLINEATALYWIWKNDRSDYVGLNHYRRYFESVLNPGVPVQEWELRELLQYADLVVTDPLWMKGASCEEALKRTICEEAFRISREIVGDIFAKRGGKEEKALQTFLSGHLIYPCQMFMMPRKYLEEYCNWLFPIVREMTERMVIAPDWDAYSRRVIGFWTERFLTVWLLKSEYSLATLPILLTDKKPSFGKG